MTTQKPVEEATYIPSERMSGRAHKEAKRREKKAQRLVSMIVVLFCFAFLIFGGIHVISAASNAYLLKVDGEEVCTLVSRSEAESAIQLCVEQQSAAAMDEYDYDVSYTNKVEIATISAVGVVYSTVSEAAELLAERLHFVADASALLIDDQICCYVANENAAIAVVKAAKEHYTMHSAEQNLIRVYTTEKISVTDVLIERDSVMTVDEATNLLVYGSEKPVANPEPMVTVNVERELVETTTLPYETVRVENNEMPRSTEEIVTPGEDGLQNLTVRVTEVNGQKSSSEVIGSEVVKAAVDEVVEVGTMIMFSSRGQNGSGQFGWPLAEGTGLVTSRFGWRSLGWHSGVDIANPVGTPIYAAESGTVVFADYDGSGYGNLVEIDHGDGFQTRYAHCDTILVSAGDYVERGMAIATIGLTGRTTGPHVHFEVRIDGDAVDPLLYLDYSE